MVIRHSYKEVKATNTEQICTLEQKKKFLALTRIFLKNFGLFREIEDAAFCSWVLGDLGINTVSLFFLVVMECLFVAFCN